MRQRDLVAVSALRSALSALANAEAVPVDHDAPLPGPESAGHSAEVAGAALGVGATEVDRRALSEAEAEQIVRAEADERDQAAAGYRQAGRAERAERLGAEAAAIRAVLDAP